MKPDTAIPRLSIRKLILSLCLTFCLGVLLFTSFSRSVLASNDPTYVDALVNLSGKVTDPNGQPLAGITITVYRSSHTLAEDAMANQHAPLGGIYWQAVRVVNTSTQGEYKAISLGAGIYRIKFEGVVKGYETIYYGRAARIDDAQDILVTGSSITDLNITLYPAATLSGTVSIMGEQNANGGTVYALQKVNSTVTTAGAGSNWAVVSSAPISTTGAYSITALPAGVYRLWASAYLATPDGYYMDYFEGYYGGLDLESAQSITIAAGETKDQLDIIAGMGQNNGLVSGQVTSVGTPLAGIKVSVYNTNNGIPGDYYPGVLTVFTSTDSAGQFSIGGLANGSYVVEFSDPSGIYATAYYEQKRLPSQALVLRIDKGNTFSNVNESLVKAGTISGTLRYASGASPAAIGVQYFYQENGLWNPGPMYSASTDSAGQYTIKNLWPGAYQLLFYSYFALEYYGETDTSGWNLYAKTITVEAGSTMSNVNQILGPDGMLFLPVVHR